MNVEQYLDAKGLSCPLPIVKTKKAMDQLESGQVLEVHVTDKGALKDLPAWVQSSGHELINQEEENGVYKFWIKNRKN